MAPEPKRAHDVEMQSWPPGTASSASVLALTRYDTLGASSRVRFFDHVPYLLQRGLEIRAEPFFGNSYLKRLYSNGDRSSWEITRAIGNRFRSLVSIQTPVLWIEKELFPDLPAFVELPFFRGRRVIIDFDDAVALRYRRRGPMLREKFASLVPRAAVVTAGSDALVEWARELGAQRVIKVPSTVDIHRLRPVASRSTSCIVIGWIGSPQTVHFLRGLLPVFHRLKEELDFELHVIGARITSPELGIRCFDWTLADEHNLLSNLDIGVMPLEISPWCRSKCAYKLVQYAAMGIPSVATAIGENHNVIEAGVTGFLASGHEDWLRHLRLLCRNHSLRAEMGQAARTRAEGLFSHAVIAPIIEDLLRGS